MNLKESGRYYGRLKAATQLGMSLDEYESKIASGNKWCTACKSWQPLKFFNKDKSRTSGYNSRCKVCCSISGRILWVKVSADPKRLEQKRERERRGGRRSRRKYKRNLPRIPKYVRDLRWKEYEGKCAYCSNEATTFDHVIPASKNGTNEAWNIVPACGSCNSSKQASDLFEWIDKRDIKPVWMLWEQIADRISIPA